MTKNKDKIIINNFELDVIVAVTDLEHQKGLMYKKWPPPIMVFPYKNSSVRKFWMKNTPSPLDIVFCKNNKVIEIFYGNPNECTLLGPEEEVDLVVEFPRGFCKNNNIHKNDELNIKYSLKTLARLATEGI